MKTLSIFSRKALLLAVAAVTFALPGRAQLIQNTYLNVDWQVTVPLGSAFAYVIIYVIIGGRRDRRMAAAGKEVPCGEHTDP